MFSQHACIHGCNVYIYIFMDVMFECMYATSNLSIVCIIYSLLSH